MLKHARFLFLLLFLLSICPLVLLFGSIAKEELYIYIVYAGFYYTLAIILFLLAIKKLNSSMEVYSRLKLLSWNLTEADPLDGIKKGALQKKIYIRMLLLCGPVLVLFFTLLLAAKTEVLTAVYIALSAGLYLSGMMIYLSVLEYSKYGENKLFMLCHNALFLAGAKIPLDGRKNAIYEVNFIEERLVLELGIKQGRSTGMIRITVPKDQTSNVNEFIAGLKMHFEQQQMEEKI